MNRHVRVVAGKQQCHKCRRFKELSAFYFNKSTGRTRTYCAKCAAKSAKARRVKNPSKSRFQPRDYRLWRNYRITQDQYDAQLDKQRGRCAICETDDPKHHGFFVVDHCHKTGRIRGLVCQRCNEFIGKVEKNRGLLNSVLAYIDNPEPAIIPHNSLSPSPGDKIGK